MQVTISKAAQLAKVSRATIYNDIKSGIISAETGPKERQMVNIAELERVYKKLDNTAPEPESKDVEDRQIRHEVKIGGATDQIAVLQERLEAQKKQTLHFEELLKKEQEERKRERENAKQFEDYIKAQIESQAASIKNFTRLLEDQRKDKEEGGNAWPQAIKSLEERIANSEALAQKEIEDIKKRAQTQIARYKKELEEERDRSFVQKIFGKKRVGES